MKFKTKTTVKNNFVVIDVFQDNEFWHTYDFRIEKIEQFLKQISQKQWGTVENLQEIKTSTSYGNI
jgi:hypothetical protein